jgi:bis(5'-nucleosyl)-tetraphosphatase (symmetrical)
MSIYLVGDIQGCYAPLQRALEQVHFDEQRDELWSVGDMINRGPENLAVVRFLQSLGASFRCVLGNHDLHFLAVALGAKKAKRQDTLDDLLQAPDRDAIVEWFRHQPLAFFLKNTLVVHAGVPPDWTLTQTLSRGQEVETALQSAEVGDFLRNMYGETPRRFDESLTGWARVRAITNALTRIRFCTDSGVLDFDNKLGPESAAHGTLPWYAHPARQTSDVPIAFGHWANLDGKANTKNVFALDTGCVWGRTLTLLRLEDQVLFSCAC